MVKSKVLPSTEFVDDISTRKDLWVPIIQTFFRSTEPAVNGRYRWITRYNGDRTVRDYVLEDQGEFLLLSCRYAPNMYVRAGVSDLKDISVATTIFKLILEAKWSHPRLKQVLLRIGDRAVPIDAVVKNESHRHTFSPSEVIDLITRVQAHAQWYLTKTSRRNSDTIKGLSSPKTANAVIDSLEILCSGEVLWTPQDEEIFKGYMIDQRDGTLVSIRYDSEKGENVHTEVTRPPKFLNALSVLMFQKYLEDEPNELLDLLLSAYGKYLETDHTNTFTVVT